MYKTDCVYCLTLSNDRKVNMFLYGDSQVFVVTQLGGNMRNYEGIPVKQVYDMITDAWSMAGIHVTGITNFLIGDKRFWYSEQYDLTIMLETMFQRDRPDLGGGIDECYEHAWYLKLSKPADDLPDDDDIIEFLVSGLHEHGFQFPSPPASYSPTGQMFVEFIVKVHGKRVIIVNRWQRDV